MSEPRPHHLSAVKNLPRFQFRWDNARVIQSTMMSSEHGLLHKRPRVLVVDNHQRTADLFARMLRMDGCDVVCATNASHALELASEGFDAVCTDLAMPERHGIDFIRELRKMPHGAVPIVVISGQPPDLRTIVEEAGACWFLSKPCTFDELVGTVRLLLSDCSRDCAHGVNGGPCPYDRRRRD